jgi:hypothetical protein
MASARTPAAPPLPPLPALFAVGMVDFIERDAADIVKRIRLALPAVRNGEAFDIVVEGKIGSGAFGAVYRARSAAWRGDLAVKVAFAQAPRRPPPCRLWSRGDDDQPACR